MADVHKILATFNDLIAAFPTALNVISNGALAGILIGLETLLETTTPCPCDPELNGRHVAVVFAVPAVILPMVSLMVLPDSRKLLKGWCVNPQETDSLRPGATNDKSLETDSPKPDATNDKSLETDSPKPDATNDKSLETDSPKPDATNDKSLETDSPKPDATNDMSLAMVSLMTDATNRRSLETGSPKIPDATNPQSQEAKVCCRCCTTKLWHFTIIPLLKAFMPSIIWIIILLLDGDHYACLYRGSASGPGDNQSCVEMCSNNPTPKLRRNCIISWEIGAISLVFVTAILMMFHILPICKRGNYTWKGYYEAKYKRKLEKAIEIKMKENIAQLADEEAGTWWRLIGGEREFTGDTSRPSNVQRGDGTRDVYYKDRYNRELEKALAIKMTDKMKEKIEKCVDEKADNVMNQLNLSNDEPPPGPGESSSNEPPPGPGESSSNEPPSGPGESSSNEPPQGPGESSSNEPPQGPGESSSNEPPPGDGESSSNEPPPGDGESSSNARQ